MPQSSILGNIANAIRHPLDTYYNYVAPPVTAAPPGAPLWQQPPSQFVPDAFPQSQQVKRYDTQGFGNAMVGKGFGGMALNNAAWPEPINSIAGATGLNNIYTRTPEQRAAAGLTAEPSDMWQTTAHEAGHSIWNEFTPEQQAAWNKLHAANPHMLDSFYQGVPNMQAFYAERPAHAFADAYGQYAAKGSALRSAAPEVYNFIKDASGIEYRSGEPRFHRYDPNVSWGK